MMRILATTFFLLFLFDCFGQSQAGRPTVSVDTVADLIARNPVPNERVVLSGWRTNGDMGAQRILRHDPTSVAATNLGCVFGNAGAGRYLAEDCNAGEIDVRWFGAVGDGVTDDTTALQAAISYARTLTIPANLTILFSSRITKTNFTDGFTLNLYGTLRRADGCNDHLLVVGEVPAFSSGYAVATRTNVTINGGGTGVFDGNAQNAAEYFPTSTLPAYGGHGIYVLGVDGVRIQGLTVRDEPNYAVAVRGSRNVLVSGNIVSTGNGNNSTNYNGKNQDGIHLTDCVNAVVSGNRVKSSDDQIALTTLGGNSENLLVANNILEHNYLTSTSGIVGPYGVLANGVRVSVDTDTNTYIRDVVIEGNELFGGNGGITLQSGVSARGLTRNVSIRGNQFHSKTNVGVGTYLCRYHIIANHFTNLVIEGNQFRRSGRQLYFQDGDELTIRDNEISDEVENANITSGSIFFDGANSGFTSSGILIDNNRFERIRYSAVKVSGLKSGAQMYSDVAIRRNFIRSGPKHLAAPGTGSAALSVEGVLTNVDISNNDIGDWDGFGVFAVDNPGDMYVTGNSFTGMGGTFDTTSQVVLASITNGLLAGVVDFSGNRVVNAQGGIDLRNFTMWSVQGNTLINARQASLTSEQLSLALIGDGGSLPVTTAVGGSIIGNTVVGANLYGIRTVTASLTYGGAMMQKRGNNFSGITIPFNNLDKTWVPDWEYSWERSYYGTTTSVPFGSYHRYLDSGNLGGQGLLIDRVNTATGALSANAGIGVVNRLQGTGNNVNEVRGILATASNDRTNMVDKTVAIEGNARWTSSGVSSNLYGVSGRVIGTGSGVGLAGRALQALAPSLSGGATLTASYGLDVADQAVAGVTTPYGLMVRGASVTNMFEGLVYGLDLSGSVGPFVNDSPSGGPYIRSNYTWIAVGVTNIGGVNYLYIP